MRKGPGRDNSVFFAVRKKRQKASAIITITEAIVYERSRTLLQHCLQCYLISFCMATSWSAPYILRSFGFSILPVGLRGTSAKMILRGRW